MLAIGLPQPAGEERTFDDDDVELLAAFGGAMQIFGDEPVLALVRVVGSSLARIAETADAMFLTEVEGPIRGAAARPSRWRGRPGRAPSSCSGCRT